MQIDKIYKLEKAVSKDENIGNLHYIYCNKNQTAMATNGRLMVVVPCVVSKGDKAGRITPDALTYARKHTLGKGAALLHLIDDSTVVAEDTTSFPREIESKVVEKGEQLELLRVATPTEKQTCEKMIEIIPERTSESITLTINPALLKTLGEAMGSPNCITLHLTPNEDRKISSIIRVETSSDIGSIGAIMPMRMD